MEIVLGSFLYVLALIILVLGILTSSYRGEGYRHFRDDKLSK